MKYTPGYQAALNSAAFYRIPGAGYLRVAGADQTAFLQRQTTNDVNKLSGNITLQTVLTSPTARILDVFTLFQEKDAGQTTGPSPIAIVTLPGRAEATFRFLKSRIFFMDKVTLTNATGEWDQLDMLGPGVEKVLGEAGKSMPAQGQWSELQLSGIQVRVLHPFAVPGLGYRLIFPSDQARQIEEALADAGAAQLSPEETNILRVEMGRPSAGSELIEEFTPLETGLESSISDSKGCYTGQEIIARQVTYDKVTQRLCGLRLENAATPGDRVWIEGKNVGRITTSAVSPRFGPLALAVIKRPYFQPGTEVKVGAPEEGIQAVTATVPFS